MIRSMTGYGRYEAENEESRLVVEIKSVNHRYCDISIRLPKILNPYENLIRKQLKEKISRGKVDVFITYENIAQGEDSIAYHPDMARAYVNLIRQLSDDFSLNTGLDAAMLSRYPDVYTMEENHIDEDKLQKLVETTVEGALLQFLKSRETEGELLKNDLLNKLTLLEDVTNQIEKRSPQVFTDYKERLTAKIKETLADNKLDESVLATELVIYADKICVDEELVRLKSHIQHMREILETEETVGRKLDFMTQELNREANTTLSKANDIIIADLGIILKTEIEKFREQIQNLE
ncbi:MAG: YicC family protein [Clostridiales bacterium]|nr:YicC family protein [Clostridiales bacterium]